ncbi:MAG: S-layer homology domain-containing protein [Firmicutes bacterium]|nr:S-layer homology domain-containing protein [Bacillota bacterium]
MILKKILSALLSASVIMTAGAAFGVSSFAEDESELFYETYDMTEVEPDGENGVVLEVEVPDGDYTVTVTTGGDAESDANIYINGGERVRAYTLAAGETQENEQAVVPLDGMITVQILGENPMVTAIEIEQLENRTEPGEKLTIYIAGDSTAQTYNYTSVYPQTGWGQVFAECFTDDVIVENRSMGGRSSKSYNNDGRLDKILTELKPGDYVFIQFGINDGAVEKPERYISVEDYKTLITDKYIGETVKRGGIPVLMTATAASWWDEENECFSESRADYADPTRELAEELGVNFIDINRIMTDEWNSMDKDDVLAGYFICEPLESKAYPTGTDDHTHLKALGARRVAGLIADAIPECVPELAEYLADDETVFSDISGHWGEEYITALAEADLIDGDENGKFNPDGTVTRAELLKMAMDAAGIASHAYREDECLDASNDDWYCYYLQGALDKDIIPQAMIADCESESVTKVLSEATETAEAVTADVTVYTGDFDGDTAITREETAAIVMNCFSYALKNADSPTEVAADADYAFSDSDIYEEYINAVDTAYSYGLVNGMGDGTFSPKDSLTRAQAAAIISRLADLLK